MQILAMKAKVVASTSKAIGQRHVNLALDVTVNQIRMEKVARVLKRKVCLANTFLY